MTSPHARDPRPASVVASTRRLAGRARSAAGGVRGAVSGSAVAAEVQQLRAELDDRDARLRAHIDAAAGAAVEAAIAAARHHAEAAVAAGTAHAVEVARVHADAAVAAAVATATTYADDADGRQHLAVQRAIDHAVRVATDSIIEHMRRTIEIAVARARNDVQRAIDDNASRAGQAEPRGAGSATAR